jgi:hypothetical protein
MAIKPDPAQPVSDSSVITKAALRAADLLNIRDKDLAVIIGVSAATVSRMRKGMHPLPKGQKPFELATLFVRLYRSLDAIVGGNDRIAQSWIRNFNTALNGNPIELIQSVRGLVNVIDYLDARRALV